MNEVFRLDPYASVTDRQRAFALYRLATLALVVLILGLFTQFISYLIPSMDDEPVLFIIAVASGILFMGYSIRLTQQGKIRPAAWLFVLAGFWVATLSTNNTGTSFLGMIWITLATSGLILSTRDVQWVVGVTAGILLINFLKVDVVYERELPSALSIYTIIGVSTVFGLLSWLVSRSVSTAADVTALNETQRRLLLTETSTVVTQQIFARRDLEILLKDTVELLINQFADIYHAQVFLIDPATKEAKLRASTGEIGSALLAKGHSLPVGSKSVIGQVTAQGKWVLASDTTTDPFHRANELLPNTLTELALPLRSKDSIIGALDLQSTKRNAFTESDVSMFQTLADQIAVAVDNARLFHEAREEAQRARALAEASQITNQISKDINKGLSELFETIARPGNFTHWWAGILQPGSHMLNRISAHNIDGTALLLPDQFDIWKDQNTITTAVQSKRQVVINNMAGLPYEMRQMFGKHIVMPILNRETQELVGAVLVGRPEVGADLDERDFELVSSLVSQVSITLENQRLFRQIASEQKILQSIIDATPAAIVVVNTQMIIQVTNERARKILGEEFVPGRNFTDIFHVYRARTHEPYPQEEIPIFLTLEHGQIFSAEDMVIRQTENHPIDLLSWAAPLKDEYGNITGAVAVYQDITELRELERALQDSLSETTKLYEASRAISRANDVSSISDAVIDEMQMLHPSKVYVTLQQQNKHGEITTALVGIWPESEKPLVLDDLDIPRSIIVPDRGLSSSNFTFATRNIQTVPGITEEEANRLREMGVNALVVMPLDVRNQYFGSIIATFEDERTFTPDERRFLLTLADQAAIALDAVLLFESTQEALQSTANLYRASRAIAEAQDITEALEVLQSQLMMLEPDRIDVILSDDPEDFSKMNHVLAWAKNEMDAELSSLPQVEDYPSDILSREQYFIDNVADAPLSIPLVRALIESESPYRAVASVPFRATGQPTGRLTVAFKQLRLLSEEEQQFMRMLADSTAYIIENDMLFKQTQDSLEETGILYQAIRAFANAENKDGVLQAIIDYAADPAVDKALLCTLLTEKWESSDALMEVTSSWVRGDAVDLTGMRFTAEQFPSWEQISTTEILWVDDVMEEPSLDETARMGYRALDISSFVIVPLIASGNPIGAILLGSAEPRQHSEREIRIYQSLADQAAITLENNRLYEQSERRSRQLGTSAQVSQAVSSILPLDELLPKMVDLIKDAFNYDHVQIFLLDDDAENAVLKASTGEAGRQLLSIKHFLPVGSRSVIGQVTLYGRPSIALDTADARVIHKPNPYLPNTRSEMAVPLISKGQILGALDVQSNQPGAFTDEDVRILSTLADQLATAIENASLFELSQRRSEEMSFLFHVTVEATGSEEMDQILQQVSELLLHQMEASLVVPYMVNPARKQLEPGALASVNSALVRENLPSFSLDSNDILAEVARLRNPILLSSVRRERNYTPRWDSIQSGIYMPLLSGENLIGVLVMESERANKFDENTLRLLQALTGSLSAIIQNSRLLKELKDANERLREVDKLKTNFLAAMSHELRTPLNSIIGFSRVILKGIDGPINELQEQDLQTIHDSGKHLLGLVNDILDQAKIEAGKMELSHDYFDLSKVIKGVMSSAKGLTKEKDIRLNTEMDNDLPLAYGDEFRTRQIILNLVSNAAKFTLKGSITTSAHVITENDRKFIQVSVTDTGIGIKEEDFAMLFESFQQVDSSTTRAAEGTGLGLPLAKSLTELQGGRIWVESEVGVGSTFSITVPTDPIEPPDEQDVEEERPLEVPPPPKFVLAIEDDVDMINQYRRYLSRNGYEVIGVTKPDEVMERLGTYNCLAIILDVNMNEGRGWEVLSRLSNHENQVPVIVCSLNDDAEQSSRLGAVKHLIKPFLPDQLNEAVREIDTKVSQIR